MGDCEWGISNCNRKMIETILDIGIGIITLIIETVFLLCIIIDSLR